MRRFSKAFLYLVYAVIVVGLVIIIVTAFTKKTSAPKVAPTKQPTSSQPAAKSTTQPPSKSSTNNTAKSSSSSTTGNSTATNSNAGSTASNSNSPNVSSSNTSSQLANTGPGNIAIIFGLSSTGAAVGYWFNVRRKLNA